jgi:hypothetical protein
LVEPFCSTGSNGEFDMSTLAQALHNWLQYEFVPLVHKNGTGLACDASEAPYKSVEYASHLCKSQQ